MIASKETQYIYPRDVKIYVDQVFPLANYIDVLFNTLKAVGSACLIWALGWLIGLAVKHLVAKILSKIGFDEWIWKISLGRVIKRTGYLPHEFMGNLSAWMIYIVFTVFGIYVAGAVVRHHGLMEFARTLIDVYIKGFLTLLLIVIIGFALIDAFIGYVYKSTELKAEMQILYPLAEYLRIVLYIAVVVYAVEQSGLSVGVLTTLLIPMIWGVTIITVLFVVYLIMQNLKAPRTA